MISVLIVSPVPALRAGLRALLAGDPDLDVVGAVASIEEQAVLPDAGGVLVVTPGALAGDEQDWAARQEAWAVLLVGDDVDAAAALARLLPPGRPWGLLSSEATPEALQAALRALAEGLFAASPGLAREALARAAESETQRSAGVESPAEPLTERETEVLRLAAQGLTNKQIALALRISEHTVKFHVSAIYAKMGVSNRAEAVRMGARWGWVPL